MTANYACMHGRITVVTARRRATARRHAAQTFDLQISPDETMRLWSSPRGSGTASKALADPVSILANCATEPSDPDELDRSSRDDPAIPYAWGGS